MVYSREQNFLTPQKRQRSLRDKNEHSSHRQSLKFWLNNSLIRKCNQVSNLTAFLYRFTIANDVWISVEKIWPFTIKKIHTSQNNCKISVCMNFFPAPPKSKLQLCKSYKEMVDQWRELISSIIRNQVARIIDIIFIIGRCYAKGPLCPELLSYQKTVHPLVTTTQDIRGLFR